MQTDIQLAAFYIVCYIGALPWRWDIFLLLIAFVEVQDVVCGSSC